MLFYVHKLSPAFCAALLILLGSGTVVLADSGTTPDKPIVNRSKDTHAVDEVPRFDIPDGEAPTRTVEKAAQRQIEKSIDPMMQMP